MGPSPSLDAAWGIRGRRAVYGFFIVEGDASAADGSVPEARPEAGRAFNHLYQTAEVDSRLR